MVSVAVAGTAHRDAVQAFGTAAAAARNGIAVVSTVLTPDVHYAYV